MFYSSVKRDHFTTCLLVGGTDQLKNAGRFKGGSGGCLAIDVVPDAI